MSGKTISLCKSTDALMLGPYPLLREFLRELEKIIFDLDRRIKRGLDRVTGQDAGRRCRLSFDGTATHAQVMKSKSRRKWIPSARSQSF